MLYNIVMHHDQYQLILALSQYLLKQIIAVIQTPPIVYPDASN
jgi:hypothetical protein